jgi:sugar-specific transcriptional regulator TrmB
MEPEISSALEALGLNADEIARFQALVEKAES